MPRITSSVLKFPVAAAAVVGAMAVWAAPGQAQAPRAPLEFYATIAVAGFEQPVEVRQSGLKRRLDVATGAVVQSFITDRTRGITIVMSAAGRRRLALVFPAVQDEASPPLPLEFGQVQANARLTRMGGSTVAGRGCALWRYAGYQGRSGTLCAGQDGLVLQFTPDGRKTPLFQVLSVSGAHQDSQWFAPPPDYQISVLPGVGGATPRPSPPAG